MPNADASTQTDSHLLQVAQNVVRALNRRYAVLLFLVAALVVVDQAVIQPLLLRLNLYAPVINVAGRQRMLSQKVTKAAFALERADSVEEAAASRNELVLALNQWSRAHSGLIDGDPELGLPGTTSIPIRGEFAKLEPDFRAMKDAVTALASVPTGRSEVGFESPDTTELVETILLHEREYLPVMDRIVGMYEAEAGRQVTWLRLTGISLMAGVLVLLLVVGIAVLRPAQNVIRRQVQELSATQHRYRRLVEQMTDGLATYNDAGKLTYANGRFCELMGKPLDDLIGMELLDLVAEESRQDLAAVVEEGAPYYGQAIDVDWISSGARTATMVCVCRSRRDPNGEDTNFAVITDISERKRAEELLRESRDQLEQRVAERTTELTAANEQLNDEVRERKAAEARTQQLAAQLAHASRVTAIGQLATGLAHELNQPLAAINNYAESCELLLEQPESDFERVGAQLQGISRSALRAGEIIRRVRNFVRPGSGERSLTNVALVLRDVHELCRPEAARSGVEFNWNADLDLPEVLVDVVQIQQVLVNLIQNSIQALEAQLVEPRELTMRAVAAGRWIHVEVTDNGPGFADDANEAFVPFFTTKPGGLGMGLAICRSIIHQHDGRLWARNSSDGGASVVFTLPTGVSNENRIYRGAADNLCR